MRKDELSKEKEKISGWKDPILLSLLLCVLSIIAMYLPFNIYRNFLHYFPSIHQMEGGEKYVVEILERKRKTDNDIHTYCIDFFCCWCWFIYDIRLISLQYRSTQQPLLKKQRQKELLPLPILMLQRYLRHISPQQTKLQKIQLLQTPYSNHVHPFSIHLNRLSVIPLKTLWVSLSGIDFSHFDTPPDGDARLSYSFGFRIVKKRCMV